MFLARSTPTETNKNIEFIHYFGNICGTFAIDTECSILVRISRIFANYTFNYLNNKPQLFIVSEIKGLLIFNDNGDEMPL